MFFFIKIVFPAVNVNLLNMGVLYSADFLDIWYLAEYVWEQPG